jgi:hypothetical protein
LGFLRDCFTLKVSPWNFQRVNCTKRDLLKTVSCIYDPLGFLSCILIVAKILLQDVWRLQVEWDDVLPEGIQDRWHDWCEALKLLEPLTIPRCYTPGCNPPLHQELHIFSDASSKAYGCCAYLVSRFPDGTTTTALVMSKARVASIKYQTIPKQELNSAVLGTRSKETIRKELSELNIPADKIFMWTDSTTVLRWINSESQRLPVFVANRVSEILESTQAEQWRYVPTDINPADDASRGLDAAVLGADHRWFTGPAFLYDSPDS